MAQLATPPISAAGQLLRPVRSSLAKSLTQLAAEWRKAEKLLHEQLYLRQTDKNAGKVAIWATFPASDQQKCQ
ncbi:hypothetical protein GXP70_26580 [Paenibacillus lycopersici]|uniref:Uncharacterized protein n=1 Tax=Paenibacillus lycopersici TaxID=2704462 RepID=A0A6C0G2W2_9BACL|nr:hypothetical protein [Paenibacillus lycopersici]QHT63177.1 hypothetical protein GXP70_26580 [Paenibacillus lycopersici]